MELIYMGEKYWLKSSGQHGPFMDSGDGSNYHWNQVQSILMAALEQGVQVQIRTATPEELAQSEACAVVERAKLTAALHSSEQKH